MRKNKLVSKCGVQCSSHILQNHGHRNVVGYSDTAGLVLWIIHTIQMEICLEETKLLGNKKETVIARSSDRQNI